MNNYPEIKSHSFTIGDRVPDPYPFQVTITNYFYSVENNLRPLSTRDVCR